MQSVLNPIVGPRKQVPPDLSGRIAVVTGGALGIGFEVSRAFAKAHARVVMINRKEEQGDEAIRKIKGETPNADIEWVGCDLGNLKEVKDVFAHLAKKESRLDILVLSAGINSNQYGLDTDGIDRHFGVNVLGHFLAINVLYPLIRATSKLPNTLPPRIVFEASEMHRMAPHNVHFGSLEEINNDKLGPMELYGRTKLALILYAKYGLVEKVIKPNKDNIFALSVHPGAVNTDMQEQWKASYPGATGKIATALNYLLGRDVEQGSYSAIYAATSVEPVEKNWNGYYFSDPGTPGKETAQASDYSLGVALWELSTRLVESKLGEGALIPWDQSVV